MKKKLILYIGALLLCVKVHAQTPITINPDIFGQNLWNLDLQNFANNTSPSGILSKLPLVAAAGVKTVRIGGIGPNNNPISQQNLLTLVTAIQNEGMKVIIQVSYDGSTVAANITAQANAALQIVNFINVTNNKNVTDWIISNEPDGDPTTTPPHGFGWDGTATSHATNIQNYIKEFSTIMKTTTGPAIKIIGPGLTNFSAGYTQFVTDMKTGPNNILNHVDEFSFHVYPSSTLPNCATPCTTNRASVISYPQGSFKQKINDLAAIIGTKPMAITEINTSRFCTSLCGTGNPVDGADARSFVAGQMLAEMFAVAIETGKVSHGCTTNLRLTWYC